MKNIILIILLFFLLLGCIGNKPTNYIKSSLIKPCEKKIDLFQQKSDWIIEKERAYFHFVYKDEYPSKKAFVYLEKKLLQCGWEHYKGNIKFLKGNNNWMHFQRSLPKNEIDLVHQFGRFFIDISNKRIATIFIQYISKSNNLKELYNLDRPNNDIQYITVQINKFNEKEYKEVIDKFETETKSKR